MLSNLLIESWQDLNAWLTVAKFEVFFVVFVTPKDFLLLPHFELKFFPEFAGGPGSP